MKKFNLLVIACLISTIPVFSQFSGGDGSVGNPYQITHISELQNVNSYLSSHFKIMNRITAGITSTWNGGTGFVPIGSQASPFTGTLTGQKYSIDSLFINLNHTWYVGLFGYVGSTAEISNVQLSNVNITAHVIAGAFAAFNQGIITDCSVTGQITGTSTTGGFIGTNDWTGSISSCMSNVDVTTGEYAGGFAGVNYNLITNCYSKGFADAGSFDNYAGGFTAINYGTISYCYSTGAAIGAENVGGFCGSNDATITDCYWDLWTSGNLTSYGGVGKTSFQMKSYSTFSNWNFSTIWSITYYMNYGYPFLNSQGLVGVDPMWNVISLINGNNINITWNFKSKDYTYKVYSSDLPEGPCIDVSNTGTFDGSTWTGPTTDSKKFYKMTYDDGL